MNIRKIPRLKKRRDFLYVAKTPQKWATRGLVLQVRVQPESGKLPAQRVGFTATKKTGNAVRRNRIKRRLRALADDLLPRHAITGHDFVLIGRYDSFDRPFAALQKDLLQALRKTGAFKAE